MRCKRKKKSFHVIGISGFNGIIDNDNWNLSGKSSNFLTFFSFLIFFFFQFLLHHFNGTSNTALHSWSLDSLQGIIWNEHSLLVFCVVNVEHFSAQKPINRLNRLCSKAASKYQHDWKYVVEIIVRLWKMQSFRY